jgi:Holliday junction resolvase
MTLRKPSNNRRRGHDFEREICKLFRELGYSKVRTTRQASRLLDESKVDIWGIPFNIQCKDGVQKGLNYAKVLSEMKELLATNFPETDTQITFPKLIIHKKPPFGKKRVEEDTLVITTLDDFVKLINRE